MQQKDEIKEEDKWKHEIGRTLPKMIHSQLLQLARFMKTKIPTSAGKGTVKETRNKLYQLILGSHASVNDPKKMLNLINDINNRDENLKNDYIKVNKIKDYQPEVYLLDFSGKIYDYYKHINYYSKSEFQIISNIITNAKTLDNNIIQMVDLMVKLHYQNNLHNRNENIISNNEPEKNKNKNKNSINNKMNDNINGNNKQKPSTEEKINDKVHNKQETSNEIYEKLKNDKDNPHNKDLLEKLEMIKKYNMEMSNEAKEIKRISESFIRRDSGIQDEPVIINNNNTNSEDSDDVIIMDEFKNKKMKNIIELTENDLIKAGISPSKIKEALYSNNTIINDSNNEEKNKIEKNNKKKKELLIPKKGEVNYKKYNYNKNDYQSSAENTPTRTRMRLKNSRFLNQGPWPHNNKVERINIRHGQSRYRRFKDLENEKNEEKKRSGSLNRNETLKRYNNYKKNSKERSKSIICKIGKKNKETKSKSNKQHEQTINNKNKERKTIERIKDEYKKRNLNNKSNNENFTNFI